MSSLTLAQASTIVDAALAKWRATDCAPLTVAVLDSGGHLVAFKREDRSGILRPDIAHGKAWCTDSEVRISWRHPLVRTSESRGALASL